MKKFFSAILLFLFFSSSYIFAAIPGEISNLTSTTHSPGEKSNIKTITFQWNTPDDNTTGLSWVIDTKSDTVPDTTPESKNGKLTTTTITVDSDGSYYFHIRGVGSLGEGGQVSTVGPYIIDTQSPSQLSDFKAINANNVINLSWTTPYDSDFKYVIIRYST